MKTLNIVVPVVEKTSFETFTNKIKKNVPELTVTFGSNYDKLFYHSVVDDGFTCNPEKIWHEVCDVTIQLPEINDWILLATFKNGMSFYADPREEIKFKNPNHGLTYGKCDICNHNCQNSYVVLNVVTGEELQVGGDCVKKFGIESFDFISKFNQELYRMIVLYNEGTGQDSLSCWKGMKDARAFESVEVTALIQAAKNYYDTNPNWIKGYYIGNSYIKSQSSKEIKKIVKEKTFTEESNYVKAVINHTLLNSNLTDFEKELRSFVSNFYGQMKDACKAFFAVKAYEDSLKPSLPSILVGTQVKVEGEIIETKTCESIYGLCSTYKIQTLKGYIVERTGTVPFTIVEGKQRVSFYSIIKYYGFHKIVLDRALKNPKKGIEIINL